MSGSPRCQNDLAHWRYAVVGWVGIVLFPPVSHHAEPSGVRMQFARLLRIQNVCKQGCGWFIKSSDDEALSRPLVCIYTMNEWALFW
jgi:hypothetical protein